MVLDLHTIAAHANPTGVPWVAKEWGAFMQTWIIGAGTVGRFFCNECRRDEKGNFPSFNSLGWWGIVAGYASYLVALGIWLFTTLNLLRHVGPLDSITDELKRRDGIVIYTISLVQVGYAVMAFLQVAVLNLFARDLRPDEEYKGKPMPGNQYSPYLSFAKDMVYAGLDVTAKGGLALYCAMRVTWVT